MDTKDYSSVVVLRVTDGVTDGIHRMCRQAWVQNAERGVGVMESPDYLIIRFHILGL